MIAATIFLVLISAAIVVVRSMREERQATATPEDIQRRTLRDYGAGDFTRGCAWSVAMAGIGAFFAGIPGVVFISAFDGLAGQFGWRPFAGMGEGAWPVSILMSALWPVPLSFAIRWFARRYPDRSRGTARLFAVAVAFAVGMVVTTLIAVLHRVAS